MADELDVITPTYEEDSRQFLPCHLETVASHLKKNYLTYEFFDIRLFL